LSQIFEDNIVTRTKSGRCIHCLNYFEKVTDDHILPEAWYSQNNPPNFAKPQAPACSECNAHYGKVEKYLLIRFGATFDSEDKNYGNIADKAIRSIDPKYGKNPRDKIAREKARSGLVREIVPYFYSDMRVLPNFGVESNIYRSDLPWIPVDEDKLRDFAHKLARGVTYVFEQSYIEDNYEIEVSFPSKYEVVALVLRNRFKQLISTPSIEIYRDDDPKIREFDKILGFYLIKIWDRLNIRVSINKHF
jgi:hypothetical protein